MEISLTTRERVKGSLEVNDSAYANTQVDEKVLAGSRSVERFLQRRFAPVIQTVSFDWPTVDSAAPWEIELGINELISVSSVDAGGDSISVNDLILRRADNRQEPPYSILQILLSSNAAFHSGPTWQEAIQVTGLAGFNDTDLSYVDGELGAGINSSVKSCILNPVSNVYNVGVGSIVHMGTEKMIVTERRMSATTGTLTSNVDDANNVQIIPVSSGALFAVDEIILIDAERMRITDIAGNNLIVIRPWDGSTLGQHLSGATIYALRDTKVARGQLGTTATTHTTGDDFSVHRFPSLVSQLATAEACVMLEQESSAWARSVGSGQSQREAKGVGLEDLRAMTFAAYARNTVRGEAV